MNKGPNHKDMFGEGDTSIGKGKCSRPETGKFLASS